MKILTRSKHVEHVTYTLFFQRQDDTRQSGFAFPCDEHGVIFGDEHRSAEQRREQVTALRFGLDGSYHTPCVERLVHRYREPSVGLCECGTEVQLGGFTNTCDTCDRDYNSAGQLLAPREQWGEETGEQLSDILMADSDPWGGDY